MAEEITQETIREIVQEIIRISSLSNDSSWIPTFGLIVSIGVLAFSIIKFGQNQKQHNIAQEKSQNQFNKTQEISKKLEFMKQLEYYTNQFNKVDKDFTDSDQKYDNCVSYAISNLQILNRLSYLKTQDFVNQGFLQFFHTEFNAGKTYFNWLNFTNREPGEYDELYSYFYKIKNTLDYTYPSMVIESPFYYYVQKINAASKSTSQYEPKLDPDNSKTYSSTEEDVALIRHPNSKKSKL